MLFTCKSHRKEEGELRESSVYNHSQDLCMWLKIFPGAECRQGASWWLKARSLQLQAEGTTRVLVLHKLVSLRFGRRSKGSSPEHGYTSPVQHKTFYFTKNLLIKCQTIEGVDTHTKKRGVVGKNNAAIMFREVATSPSLTVLYAPFFK